MATLASLVAALYFLFRPCHPRTAVRTARARMLLSSTPQGASSRAVPGFATSSPRSRIRSYLQLLGHQNLIAVKCTLSGISKMRIAASQPLVSSRSSTPSRLWRHSGKRITWHVWLSGRKLVSATTSHGESRLSTGAEADHKGVHSGKEILPSNS